MRARLAGGIGRSPPEFGIWATHFVAMLAFSPGIPSGYNIILTVLSLVAAILLTGVGTGGVAYSELASRAAGSAAPSLPAA